ncbi:MAG: GDP-mannose 4,6-dehydratase [Bryobacteraceae bacterium]
MNWQGKRVVVTGADGFIGSHLVEQLVAAGAEVTALALYNSFNHWGWLEDVSCLGAVKVVTGDIRDPHLCGELLEGAEVVFHLAALIPIPYSYRAPASYVETNVQGTLNLCQAARRQRLERFVHTSTSEVYGTARFVPIDESHPLCGQSPYAASKIGADAIALSFYYSYGLPVAVARPFNTFGPRQSARAVIPTIITQIAAGRSRVRLGDATTTRDFTFVEDTCRGLMAVAGAENGCGEVFNIGTGREISIAELHQLIARLMGREAGLEQDPERMRPEKSEVRRLLCNAAKLNKATGWAPSHTLEQGLERTIAWFSDPANLRRYKPEIYNV